MSSAKKFDPYRELLLSSSASVTEIKKAFRKISVTAHPDKGGNEEKYKNIVEAYKMLTDKNFVARESDDVVVAHDFLADSGSRFSDAFKKAFEEGCDNFFPYKMNLEIPVLIPHTKSSADSSTEDLSIIPDECLSKYRNWIQSIDPYVLDEHVIGLTSDMCKIRGQDLIDQSANSKALPYLVKYGNVQMIAETLKTIRNDQKTKKSILIAQIIRFLSPKSENSSELLPLYNALCTALCTDLLEAQEKSIDVCLVILGCGKENKISEQTICTVHRVLDQMLLDLMVKAMYNESTELFLSVLEVAKIYDSNVVEMFTTKYPESDLIVKLPRHYMFKILFAHAHRYRKLEQTNSMIRCLRNAMMMYPIEETFDHVVKFYSDYQKSFNQIYEEHDSKSSKFEKEHKYNLDHISSFRFLKAYESACQQIPIGMERIWCFIDFAGAAQSIGSKKSCLLRSVFEIIQYINLCNNSNSDNSEPQYSVLSKQTVNGLFCLAKELLSLIGIYEAKYPMMSSSISVSYGILKAYSELSEAVSCLYHSSEHKQPDSPESTESTIPRFNAYENIHIAILCQSVSMINKFRSIAPLHGFVNRCVHDDVYESIMLNNLTLSVLRFCQNNRSQIMNHLEASYYLMEGSWNGWNDDEFDETRLSSMIGMLCSKGWDMGTVEKMMNPGFLPRDDQGFICTGDLTFKQGVKTFSKIHGFIYHQNKGELELITSTDGTKLFTEYDIHDIYRGIDGSLFTLDQPDGVHAHHPFQHMKYYPKSLKGTDVLATLLMTDYILKCVTTGKECSSHIPFAHRDTSEGFMNKMSDQIKQDLMPVHINKTKLAESLESTAHRFWLEAGDIGIEEETKDDQMIFLFKDPKIFCKKNVLEKNDDGIYEDEKIDLTALATLEDLEKLKRRDNSPEAVFARNFTKHYDQIAEQLPVFARLKELCKLQAVLRIIKQLNESFTMKISEQSIDTETDQIISVLTQIRSQIDYPVITQANENKLYNDKMTELRSKSIIPFYTEANVNKHVQEQLTALRGKGVYPIYTESRVSTEMNNVLVQNGVTRSQVAQSELQRVESSIRSQLQSADSQLMSQVNTSIRAQLQDEDNKIGPQVLESVKQALTQQDRDLRGQIIVLIQGIFKKQNIVESVPEQQILEKVLNNQLNQSLKELIRPLIKAKNHRIKNAFDRMADKNDMVLKSDDILEKKLSDYGECSWVPAVFCNSVSRSKVYGGVNLSCSFAQEKKINDDVMQAVRSRVGFGAMQTGKYTFEKTDTFTGDKTTYYVNTSGSGWREHVTTVSEFVQRSFKPMVQNVMCTTINTLGRLGFGSGSGYGYDSPSHETMNLRVIRRDLENVPFRTGHLAHSAILIQQGDSHHLLEVMNDGKAHLHKNISMKQTTAFSTWADYQIQDKAWRGQVKGMNIPSEQIPGGKTPEQLQSMMQELFDSGGQYNPNIASSSYNTCHSGQERLMQKLKELYDP